MGFAVAVVVLGVVLPAHAQLGAPEPTPDQATGDVPREVYFGDTVSTGMGSISRRDDVSDFGDVLLLPAMLA
jgi:hypothetical protein